MGREERLSAAGIKEGHLKSSQQRRSEKSPCLGRCPAMPVLPAWCSPGTACQRDVGGVYNPIPEAQGVRTQGHRGRATRDPAWSAGTRAGEGGGGGAQEELESGCSWQVLAPHFQAPRPCLVTVPVAPRIEHRSEHGSRWCKSSSPVCARTALALSPAGNTDPESSSET